MSNQKISIIVIIALMAASLVVVPAAAKAITQTSTFHNVTESFPDVDFCDGTPVEVTVTYSGVLHTTEYTDDDPNAGTFHGRLKLNGTVITVDGDGNIVSNDRFVKTIFHTNANRQNVTDRFSFIINGSRADGGRHRYHNIVHLNLSASGTPMIFDKLSISCP
jgi:hypothetical protein